ncbi:thioredoxin family protein [Phytoactinopolyspora endophytica]|uniref:thioredoxin family protein n=1 Tax=Phytoactinopolyspora endophytica TaxID=1642495 RepID=UPI00101BA22E|nr:thioredoxin family protein [Phytoactinopolyspora endophytica]
MTQNTRKTLLTSMNRRGSRARLLAVAALSSGLLLTACGDDDTTASQEDTDAAAPAESGSPDPMDDESSDEETDDSSTDDGSGDDEEMSGDDEEMSGDDDADPMDDDGSDDMELAAGTYREYSEDAVADAGFDTTILFFHASWCPECRAFEEAIEEGTIPVGVQILKVDYDSETELKQTYEVTLQTTFVRVDHDGEHLGTWVGYGEDRSIDAILDELA